MPSSFYEMTDSFVPDHFWPTKWRICPTSDRAEESRGSTKRKFPIDREAFDLRVPLSGAVQDLLVGSLYDDQDTGNGHKEREALRYRNPIQGLGSEARYR